MEKIQDLIAGVINKLANPLIIVSIMLSAYGAYEINYSKSPLNLRITEIKKATDEVREDVYYTLMYDIMKQSELIRRGPDAIMKSDLDKFQRICGNEGFVKFVKEKPGEPFVGDVGASCGTINRLRYNNYMYKIETLYDLKSKIKE